MLAFLLLSGIFLILVVLLQSPKQRKNFPPGPRPFGILGSFPHVILQGFPGIFGRFQRLRDQYGKVMAFDFGYSRAVIISDAKVLKEAFNNPAFSYRPPVKIFESFHDDKCRGIIIQSGEHWRELRRFTVKQLKEYGLGTRSMESAIIDETQQLLKLLRQKEQLGQSFSTKGFFSLTAVNVLWQVISGQRFHHEDPKAQQLVDSYIRIVDLTVGTVICTFYPKLAKFLAFFFKKSIDESAKINSEFARKYTESRLSSHVEGRRDDLTASFLEHIRQVSEKGESDSAFYKTRGHENLAGTIVDFFLAGSETTSTTFRWLLLFLAVHPKVQEKLQEEIDTVLNDNVPSLHDKLSMPYTEAVICETMRKSSILPFGLLHYASEDAKIADFDIPKGTMIVGNIIAIHHCQETWGDPHVFRPERFLSPDGKTVIKHEALVPFGVGKRVCLGEQLARDTLFLQTVSVFQEMTVTWDPKALKPGIEADKPMGSLMPPSHRILLSSRRKNPVAVPTL